MRRMPIRGLVVLVALAVGLAWGSAAQANAVTVTTTADPGPGGTTSLRQAIVAAGDGDTVVVPAGHFTLALGEITVAKAIIVAGAGASTTIVDANGASRVFNVSSAGTVTFENLTITGGAANVGTTGGTGGAGVLDSSGSLAFDGVSLTSNAVTGGGTGGANQGGGAIFNGGGLLSVTDSTLSGNSVKLTGSSSNNGGGAIYNKVGPVTVTRSTLSGNSVTVGGAGTTGNNGGGAIYDNSGGVTVTDSALTGNSASVSGGTGNNGGGAVYGNGGGGLTVSRSSISNNTLTIVTGMTNTGGGGIYANGGPLHLSASTVASNSATLTGTAGFNGGGGIYNNTSGLTLVNATVSDNALSAPSDLRVGGGGLYQNGSVGTITNATFTANQSTQPGGGYFGDGPATFKSTIVAANAASSGNVNCDGPTAPVSAGNNLENISPTTCNFTAGGDLVGMPAGLGPLADNGGPAPTHSLLAVSPAIDHIPVGQCTDQAVSPQPVPTDERGVKRALDGACDIGAYEFAPADVVLAANVSPTSITLGGESTLTFPLSASGPAPATNTALNVVLPHGLTLVSASPTQGNCGATASGVSCPLGVISSGGSTQVTIVVRGAAAGAQTVTATAGATEPDPTPADNTKAVSISVSDRLLSGLSVSPRRFRAASRGGSVQAARKSRRAPIGARVRYTLNIAAKVRFTVQAARPGRKVGSRCRAPSRRNRHKHRCTRYVKVRGSFTLAGHAGVNSFRFRGRLAKRKLKPGTYRLVATPSVGASAGRVVRTTFRIVK